MARLVVRCALRVTNSNVLMLSYDLGDHKFQMTFSKVRIESSLFCNIPEPGNLSCFSARVRWRHIVFRLERTDRLRAAKSLGKNAYQCSV